MEVPTMTHLHVQGKIQYGIMAVVGLLIVSLVSWWLQSTCGACERCFTYCFPYIRMGQSRPADPRPTPVADTTPPQSNLSRQPRDLPVAFEAAGPSVSFHTSVSDISGHPVQSAVGNPMDWSSYFASPPPLQVAMLRRIFGDDLVATSAKSILKRLDDPRKIVALLNKQTTLSLKLTNAAKAIDILDKLRPTLAQSSMSAPDTAGLDSAMANAIDVLFQYSQQLEPQYVRLAQGPMP